MKSTILPNRFLERMDPTDLRALGVAGKTAQERQSALDRKAERKLHDEFSQWLSLNGIFCVHSRMDKKTTQKKGIPDFLLALSPRYFSRIRGRIISSESDISRPIAVEFKVSPNGLSDDQIKVRDAMVRDGWIYVLAYSLPDVFGALEARL